MEPRTKLKIDVSPHQIDHNSRVCTIGSCFAANMSGALSKDRFQVYHNPFGTLYNPGSISKLLVSCLNQQPLDNKLNVERDERYVNYQYHSDLNAHDPSELESVHKLLNQELAEHIRNADWLIITFGTARVFRLIKQNLIVANCHKQQATQFEKETLSINSIVEEMSQCINLLLEHNRNLRIICTVSPVRHIRDGIVNNNLSKSRLVNACHELSDQYTSVEYFPSFEIMIDELRDYSFYAQDLIHPSESAVQYIYERFKKRFFSSTTVRILSELNTIFQGLNHKPFNPQSQKHRNFLKALLNKTGTLQKNYRIDLTHEVSILEKQLDV